MCVRFFHHNWCSTQIRVWTSSWGAAGVTAGTQPLIFLVQPDSFVIWQLRPFVNTNLLRGGDAGFRETGCLPLLSFLGSLYLILSHPRVTFSYFIWWVCGAAALWNKNTPRISREPLWSEPKLGWDNECTLTRTLRKEPANYQVFVHPTMYFPLYSFALKIKGRKEWKVNYNSSFLPVLWHTDPPLVYKYLTFSFPCLDICTHLNTIYQHFIVGVAAPFIHFQPPLPSIFKQTFP